MGVFPIDLIKKSVLLCIVILLYIYLKFISKYINKKQNSSLNKMFLSKVNQTAEAEKLRKE